MFSWNDPYILPFIIGLVAVGLFYFDQKQKKEDPDKMSYFKVFTLVTSLIFCYNYFVDSTSVTYMKNTLTSVSEVATKVTEPQAEVVKTIVENVLPNTPVPVVANTLSGIYSNLKIKEGPPNF